MQNKLKYISIIMLSLVAIALLTPYFIGIYVEKNYTTFMKSLSLANTSIKLMRYKRGWFSATAEITITDKTPLTTFHKTLTDHIYHGLIIPYTDTSGKHWRLGLASSNTHIPGQSTSAPINASVVWGLTKSVLYLNTAHYQISNPYLTLKTDNLNAKYRISPQHHIVTGKMAIGHLSLSLGASSQFRGPIEINNIQLTLNRFPFSTFLPSIKKIVSYHRQAELKLNIDSINIGEGKEKLSFNGIKITQQQKRNNGKINSTLASSLSLVTLPNFTLNDFLYSFSVNNLNIEALSKLQSTMQTQQKIQPTPQEMQKLVMPGLNLVAKGLNVSSNLSTKTSLGTLKMQLKIEFTPFDESAGPIELLKNISANAQLSAARTLWLAGVSHALKTIKNNRNTPSTQQAKKIIDRWIKNKMLTASQDNLEINAIFKNGALTVNNETPNFSLPKSTATKKNHRKKIAVKKHKKTITPIMTQRNKAHATGL
jgi:hypothetical protein